MYTENQVFPHANLPSSKGGTTDLAAVCDKGPVIVAVIPRLGREGWLDAVTERYFKWILEKFVNVYLVMDLTPEEARYIADEYGLQAPILCDQAGVHYPAGEGFYRLGSGCVIERASGPAEPAERLDELA